VSSLADPAEPVSQQARIVTLKNPASNEKHGVLFLFSASTQHYESE